MHVSRHPGSSSTAESAGRSLGWPVLGMVLTLLGASCGAPSDESAVAGSSGSLDQELVSFLDEVFEHRVAQSPEWESRLGRRTDQMGRWDDRSDAEAERRVAEVAEDLERIRERFPRDQLSASARTHYDVFVFDAERQIGNHDFRDHHYVVDQFNGQLSGLLTVLQNTHPIDTRADAEAYIERLEGLEEVLDGLAARFAQRAEAGVLPPAFAFPAVISDATAMASGAPITESANDNALWDDFRSKVAEAGLEDREELESRAADALRGPFRRGFDALLGELERLQVRATSNHGVWALPRGEEYYRNRVAHHTTLDLSPEEVHQIGLDEVARIQAEMRGIQELVGFEGSLREFFDYVRDDPGNRYEDSAAGRAQFLAEAQAQVDAIYEVVGEWFHRVPEASMEVRPVEAWRENSVSIAFYNAPSQDGSRPGIYYANLGDMPAVQRYVFGAITYHESVPGHHFQIALAQEMDGLPKLRRFAGGFGAFTEGWALYAEQLAKEMGFYAEPLQDFGRLQNELWRAARLVLDTGIHAKRWTREQSIDYFRENTPLSEGNIVTEVERFFVNPGQGLSYKIGMIEILRLREEARRTAGESFDIRDFHEAVVGAGALPLPILGARVREAFPPN